MKNTQKPFRLAIFNALNGQLSYNSTPVPVTDERKLQSDTSKIYVIFGRQTETPIEENDCAFITQSTIDLLIVSKTFSETSKDTVNDIADDILELLLTTPQINGFTEPSGFQVQNIKLGYSETGTMRMNSTDIMLTQLLTITAQIVQQS